jgi:hypothetical protein
MAAMADGAVRRSKSEAADVELVSAAVSVLCALVDDLETSGMRVSVWGDLVKRWENVICKLHLRDGSCANGCHADGKPCDSLF